MGTSRSLTGCWTPCPQENAVHSTSLNRGRGKSFISSGARLLSAVIALAMMLPDTSFADVAPAVYRVGSAYDTFEGTSQVAAGYHLGHSQRFGIHHLELAVGAISKSDDRRAFASIGPVWRIELVNPFYADLGISPTLLSGSTFGNKDLGGTIHFTSSLSIGAALGRRHRMSIALRIQHISNGGLNDTNPGMNMVALSFMLNPGEP